METAFAYKRVSSLEQKEKKNSIPEQTNRIQKFANDNNIKIIKEFEDGSSAFHDENRENFEQMVQLALIEKPDYILLDDSSRFARTRQVAIETKQLLRSHGISILYASEPNIDTSSVAGFWLEGIQEIKNEATSREIAYHTKKGMSGNLMQRDPKTGWCYKNGGKAPYGYKRNVLYIGINPKGKPIYKTIWELDPDTSPIVRTIIVDLYTKKEMSYQSIRDYLNNNGIKNSNGGVWSISTISSMLRPDRLEEYCGIAIWNKENKNIKGVKYNPRSEWIICDNAHPAIITPEEVQNALDRKSKTSNNHSAPKSTTDYLLTGSNIDNNFLFTCSECGGHVVGCSTGKKHIKKYSCGSNRYKGNCACQNNWKVNKDWLEDKILELIENNYFCDKKAETTIDNLYQSLCNKDTAYQCEMNAIQKQINTKNSQMQNLLEGIKNGLNSEIAIQEINHLKEEIEKEKQKLNHFKTLQENQPHITRENVAKYFYNIKDTFEIANIQEKRELLKTFVYNISLNYLEHHIEITLCYQWCRILEQVAGLTYYAPPTFSQELIKIIVIP